MGSELQRSGVDVNQTRAAQRDLQNVEAQYRELATDATLAAGGALPPPWGTAADVASLGRSLYRGDWSGALLDVVGFVPLLGDGIKGGRVASRLNDVRRALDVAQSAVARNLRRTREAAERYWNNVARRNRQQYEDAIRTCRDQKCRDAAALKKGPQYAQTPVNNGSWSGDRGDSVWKPDNGGPEIRYQNGFPDYSSHASQEVDIAMTGSNRADFAAAAAEVRRKPGKKDWVQPPNTTWHHHENGTTMQLLPDSIHATGRGATTPHTGGASLYRGGHSNEF